jgi:glycosyltransferase involved in cell wall biosynthesis
VKKLLVFTEVFNRGGSNRSVVDFVNSIADDFDEVCIANNSGALYPEDIRRLARPVTFCSVAFITRARFGNHIRSWPMLLRKAIAVPLLFLEPLFLICNVVLFCLLIGRLKPSRVLSCNGGYPAAAACLAMVVSARLLRRPVVLSIVSVATARKPFMWLYEKFVDHLVWRSVDFVIVNAQAIAYSLGTTRDMPHGKVEVIYNGLEEVPPAASSRKEDGRFVIGCIARMDAAKGVLILLDAFAVLAESRPELRLVLAGHGDASAELLRRTKALGLDERVEMLGHYDGDVDALIRTFDLYVFPSLWEGFPFSIVEAMRAGAAIITTRVGGIPEAIMDGQDGLLIQPGSKDEIVKAIERLLDQPRLRSAMGHNARLKYESSLTLDRMRRRLREVCAKRQF